MHILALNPFHTGSHQALLDGWQQHSRHRFTLLTLPGYKWKWRMRHAAVTLAKEVSRLVDQGLRWDALFCTDMLNLAEFQGLAPAGVRTAPAVAYFHENQLTYPDQSADERDLHYGFTNAVTGLAADQVWFNSEFHRDEFLDAFSQLARRMPDHRPIDIATEIRAKSVVTYPGIDVPDPRGPRRPGPMRILWVSRWEHDKQPALFFQGLRGFRDRGGAFRVSVLGESFDKTPNCFGEAHSEFAPVIDHWGYLESRGDYRRVLAESDVVVSTAAHEFFGIAVVEAVAAGCVPLVPRGLAYPEVLGDCDEYFHDGTAAGIADRLTVLADRINRSAPSPDSTARMRRFFWPGVARQMDDQCEDLCRQAAEP